MADFLMGVSESLQAKGGTNKTRVSISDFEEHDILSILEQFHQGLDVTSSNAYSVRIKYNGTSDDIKTLVELHNKTADMINNPEKTPKEKKEAHEALKSNITKLKTAGLKPVAATDDKKTATTPKLS